MVVQFMPSHMTVSAFLMVMPLTAGTATGLIAFTAGTAIVRAITAIMVIDHRAITATDIARVITAEAGEDTVGKGKDGGVLVGKDMEDGRARAFRDTAGAEVREAAGEDEDIEADAIHQTSSHDSSDCKAWCGSFLSILIKKERQCGPKDYPLRL